MRQLPVGQSGQILLVTLLVLMLAVTVGLSVIGRTTTDVNITTQVEESARAFSAAEAGLELALKSGSAPAPATLPGSGASYDVQRANIGGGTSAYTVPRRTKRGEVESVWFVAHNADGTLPAVSSLSPTYTQSTIDLCWSQESPNPAMDVAIIYRESTDANAATFVRVAHGAWDPDGGRGGTARFDNAPGGNCGAGTGTNYLVNMNFDALTTTAGDINPAADTLIEMRIRPLYLTTNDVQVAVRPSGGSSLPVQGNSFESTGSLGSGVTRKIIVNQLFRSASSPIFDAAIYSQSGLTH